MAEQNNSFPTISEKNWWTIREKFKSSLPSIVSTTYIKSLLSMANDNSANSNVISPLKRIGLIDDENKPTALANDWRIDDKYNKPKLKLNSGVTSSEQNEQSGYMQIFAGCMTGIRNPRAHDSDWEDTEDRALQLLMLANHLIERAQMAEITE